MKQKKKRKILSHFEDNERNNKQKKKNVVPLGTFKIYLSLWGQ